MGERGARAQLHKSPTIFVDNLPHQIRKIWVYNLFSSFGKIRDIFIPYKKSMISGHSFCFVRFNRIEEANFAISETNGRWFWNRKLMVNIARFLRKEDYQNSQLGFHNGHPNRSTSSYKNAQFSTKEHRSLKKYPTEQRGKEVWRKKGIEESSKQGEARYNKAEKTGVQNLGTQAVELHVKPDGNGWLLRSAVAKIRRIMSTQDLENIFTNEGIQNVQIKAMGGRYVIITFSEKVIRDTTIKLKWLSNWFEEINPWNGDQAKDERFVWLACFGMPLNAWSVPTFKEIGSNWGQFLQVDESTLRGTSFVKGGILIVTEQIQKIEGNIDLVIEGLKFSIRVEEEESFRVIDQITSSITKKTVVEGEAVQDYDKVQNKDNVAVENIDDDDMEEVKDAAAMNADLNTSKMDETNNSVVMASPVDTSTNNNNLNIVSSVLLNNDALSSASSSTLGIASSTMGMEKVLDSFGDNPLLNCPSDSNNEVGCINTAVNTTVIEDNTAVGDSVLNEVVLKDVEHESNQNEAKSDGLQPDLFEDNRDPIQAAVKGGKGKKKRKNINEILGLSKVNGGKSKSKCVVFRSAVAAAALSASVSADCINNRNRILLNEAQAIWEVNKIMGLGYDGDEEEVISKIAEMEAQNRERAVDQS